MSDGHFFYSQWLFDTDMAQVTFLLEHSNYAVIHHKEVFFFLLTMGGGIDLYIDKIFKMSIDMSFRHASSL